MKKTLLISGVFLLFLLFIARGGWLPTNLRLDTGDTAGANDSIGPQISSSGSNVYVVWWDERNGYEDIYFNYSTDSGATWQATDIRLDTGDIAGANESIRPQISSSGNNVYAVWQDERNGYADIYFNHSMDGGATWQASDIRLDTGDIAGANDSARPQISSNGNNVYALWQDERNGFRDIYFNYSTDGGATWQASDIRLDTGDSAGANDSIWPQISSFGSNVYAVWEDERNGLGDIYFNYSADGGATWQTIDTRLDVGDVAGTTLSHLPQINSNSTNVYVVWSDTRDYYADIYFNYSIDGGASWQTTDIRLDTGDLPGVSYSSEPQISCSGINIYAVWYDNRHSSGRSDVYFNYSMDGGATWQASDIRLTTGVAPGTTSTFCSQISSSGSNVYVVWSDMRNGGSDIYFNYSIDFGITWQPDDFRINTRVDPGKSRWPQISCNENIVFVVWEDIKYPEYYDIYFDALSGNEINVKFNILNKNIPNGFAGYVGKKLLNLIVGREFTFTIQNLGIEELVLNGSPDKVTLSGPDAMHFLVTQQPPISTIPAGGSTTFKLRTVRTTVPPVPDGWERDINFTVNIPNTDNNENPYIFSVVFTAIK